MFGNSYTALVIQINSQYAGNTIWERIKTYPFVKDIERLRVCYFDLVIIVLQGTNDVIASLRETLNSFLYSEFNNLMNSHAISVETCSQLVKNTFSRGREVDEEVESIECVRMSLVFHGFADILPFLTLLNVSQIPTHNSPPSSSPVGTSPRPPIGISPRPPIGTSPRPPIGTSPRPPIGNPMQGNPTQPIETSHQRTFQPPRRIFPQQQQQQQQQQNLPMETSQPPRPRYMNPRPHQQPRPGRPYAPSNQSLRNMYEPRRLPPRPAYSNPSPRASFSGPPQPAYTNKPRPYK